MSKAWRYMELEKIQHLPNDGRELLGKFLSWTEKRDGSCLASHLKLLPKRKRFVNWILRKRADNIPDPYKWEVITSSRNQEFAEKSIRNDFLRCKDSAPILLYLNDNPTHIVFGELLRKGISPTRIENHEEVEFIVFDIANVVQLGKIQGQKAYRVDFFSYQQVHQFCYHYDMKCVKLFGEGRFTTMDSLLKYRDKMLRMCKKAKREGVVLKTFGDDGIPLYAKEKLDTATPRGQPKIEKGKPQYSPLPFSEAMGAVDKAYADLGDAFSNKAKAMPVVARYIQEEMKKHQCSSPQFDFYRLYCDYCKDHGIKISEVSKASKVTEETKPKKKHIIERIIDAIYYAFLNAWDETNNRLRK